MDKKSFICVLFSGIFWGLLGIGVNQMSAMGFESLEITSARWVIAAIVITILSLIFNRKNMKVKLRDLIWMVSLGLFSTLACSAFLFASIEKTTAAIGDVLMYTSPIWVIIMSRIFYKEKLTKKKILCVGIVFLGCFFASGIVGTKINFNLLGFVFGISAGIAYGLYSILNVKVKDKYNSFTILTYCTISAAIGSLFLINPITAANKIIQNPVSLYPSLFLGIVGTIIPYLLYTIGLKKLSPSQASVISAVEPVVALLVTVFTTDYKLQSFQFVGIGLILLSILISNLKERV